MFSARMKIALAILLPYLTSPCVDAFASTSCPSTKFRCDDGRNCIPKQWVCDGEPDCQDRTDESDTSCAKAPARNCTTSEFRCTNKKCLPKMWQCDGADDCGDNSDEMNCTKKCSVDEFRCNTGVCITALWRCDNMPDCTDGSDELNCTTTTTTPRPSGGQGPGVQDSTSSRYFFCSDGHRLPLSFKCDADVDCSDGSDERNCTSTPAPSTSCLSNEFECSPNYCIASSWVCDGRPDCEGGQDEEDCPERVCGESEFKCTSGECISLSKKCNGFTDCHDRSDETFCDDVTTSQPISGDCDLTTHFKCQHNGRCIAREKLCNGINDCGNDQDESVAECGINECARNNGGCAHKCLDSKEGYSCACNDGFRLMGKYSCEDINECTEIPGSCSQLCVNTAGSFHCSCQPGYLRDPSDYKRCKAAIGEPYLIFSHSYDIRRIRLRDSDMTSVVTDTHGVTALDYHFSQNQILWSDRKEKKIFRANLTNTNSREVVVAEEEVAADGLAVDWIHGHIYYTDTKRMAVRMVSWDHKWTKTLASQDISQPRAIAVSPMMGFVFWSDWGKEPKIERAGLDGSDRQAIITQPHLAWPNGITIDHSTDKIYWCDGRLNTISSAFLDGSQVEVVLFSPSVLRLPYSISVFEDRMYWTDWSRLALYSANKFNGEDVKNVSAGHQLELPKVVHVYHQYRQPKGENVCLSHSCSHMCVKSAFGTALCICPDGFTIDLDGLTCVEGQEKITRPEVPFVDHPDNDATLYTSPGEFLDSAPSSERTVVVRAEMVTAEDLTSSRTSSQAGLIAGVVVGVFFVVLLAAVALVLLHRSRGSEIKRFRFNNPVYRKTTEDEDDERGFTIAQDQLFYNPTRAEYSPSFPTTEADDAPLTPEDDEEV